MARPWEVSSRNIVAGLHRTGKPFSPETPRLPGPRNCGHLTCPRSLRIERSPSHLQSNIFTASSRSTRLGVIRRKRERKEITVSLECGPRIYASMFDERRLQPILYRNRSQCTSASPPPAALLKAADAVRQRQGRSRRGLAGQEFLHPEAHGSITLNVPKSAPAAFLSPARSAYR